MNGPGFVTALFFWLMTMTIAVICVGGGACRTPATYYYSVRGNVGHSYDVLCLEGWK